VLQKTDIRDIRRKLIQIARNKLKWKGKVEVKIVEEWTDEKDLLESNGTATRYAKNGIAINLPVWMTPEEGFKEALANFLHGYFHDWDNTNPGRYASGIREEMSTYIRGEDTAKKLGIDKEFTDLGKKYAQSELGFAETGVGLSYGTTVGSPFPDQIRGTEREIVSQKKRIKREIDKGFDKFFKSEGFEGIIDKIEDYQEKRDFDRQKAHIPL